MTIYDDARDNRWYCECDIGIACSEPVQLPQNVSNKINRVQNLTVQDGVKQYKDNRYKQVQLVEEYMVDTEGWTLYKENEYDAIHVCPADVANAKAEWTEDNVRKSVPRIFVSAV